MLSLRSSAVARAPLPHADPRALTHLPRGGKFLFDFVISPGYPYDAPKVKCKTKVRRQGAAPSAPLPHPCASPGPHNPSPLHP
jgi:hypothetical protein